MSRRGPPPRKLAKLFRLKYLQGITDTDKLAELLEISKDSVYSYNTRLKRKLVKMIKHVSPERLRFVCPECLGTRVHEDPENGERVCMECGYVLDEESISSNIPFGTEEEPNTYALTSHISYGKSLGFTMPRSHLYRVVVKASMDRAKKKQKEKQVAGVDEKKIPIPIRQVQMITQTIEPPFIKNLLEYGSMMLKRFGFDRDTSSNHVFSDEYGRLLRKIGAYIIVTKAKNLQAYQVASAAFFYLLTKRGQIEKARKVKKEYPFHRKYFNLVAKQFSPLR